MSDNGMIFLRKNNYNPIEICTDGGTNFNYITYSTYNMNYGVISRNGLYGFFIYNNVGTSNGTNNYGALVYKISLSSVYFTLAVVDGAWDSTGSFYGAIANNGYSIIKNNYSNYYNF